jgi:acyl-ACP thioesterase
MNNCRYLEWAGDLLPAAFHKNHAIKDVTMCYLGEALEGDELTLFWEMNPDGMLRMDIQRCQEDRNCRIFTAEIQY